MAELDTLTPALISTTTPPDDALSFEIDLPAGYQFFQILATGLATGFDDFTEVSVRNATGYGDPGLSWRREPRSILIDPEGGWIADNQGNETSAGTVGRLTKIKFTSADNYTGSGKLWLFGLAA